MRAWRVNVLVVLASCTLGFASTAHAVIPSYQFAADAWDSCVQRDVPAALPDCRPRAALPLGVGGGVALLPFFTLTLGQTQIQDAQLHLHLLGPRPLPRLSLLIYRVEDYWDDGDVPTLSAVWDGEPVATAVPDSSGAIDVDVTATVDDWRRHERDVRQGHPNYGFAIRAVADDPQAGVAVELASSYALDPGLRPVLTTTSWPWTWSGRVQATPGPFESLGPNDVALSASSRGTDATSARFQYLAPGMTHWTAVPTSALRDDDGAPLASPDVPLQPYRSNGAIWDVSGLERDGLVRVRALIDAPSYWSDTHGATDETSFVLDRPDVPGPDPVSPPISNPPIEPPGDARAPTQPALQSEPPAPSPPAARLPAPPTARARAVQIASRRRAAARRRRPVHRPRHRRHGPRHRRHAPPHRVRRAR